MTSNRDELGYKSDWSHAAQQEDRRKRETLKKRLGEFWGPTTCMVCQQTIREGEPRLCILVIELGYGPTHSKFNSMEDWVVDVDADGSESGAILGEGPLAKGRRYAYAVCEVCRGAKPRFEIWNIWHFIQEARAADDPGGSVRTVSIEAMAKKIASQEEGDRDDESAASATEVEDQIYSGAYSPDWETQPPDKETLRSRLIAFLESPESRTLPPGMRRAAQLSVEGKTQEEIVAQLAAEGFKQVNQSTISRWLRTLEQKHLRGCQP